MCLQVSTNNNEQVWLKVALSTANIEGAIEDLKEIKGWDFDRMKQKAEDLWEAELEKIRIGFYPVNPANGEYVIGTPLSNKTVISMGDGNHFIVKADLLTDKNSYIQRATFNGKSYSRSYITHADMLKGGELVLFMGDRPSTSWGTKKVNFTHLKKKRVQMI